MVRATKRQSSGIGNEAYDLEFTAQGVAAHELSAISKRRDFQVFEELGLIEENCSMPGWDGNAAKAIPSDAFNDAKEFLYYAVWESELPLPDVEADEFGALQFSWEGDDDRMYSLSFYGKGIIGYSAYWGTNQKRYGIDEFSKESQDIVFRDILRTVQKPSSYTPTWKSEREGEYFTFSLQG